MMLCTDFLERQRLVTHPVSERQGKPVWDA